MSTYPVDIKGDLSQPPHGAWFLIKWLLAIPHYFILCFLFIGFVFVTIFAFFAILFTGKYPEGAFKYNTGVIRWAWRVSFYSYGALATDKYPPFNMEPDPNYPADIVIPYPTQLSRGLALVKWWLLAIPHYIIVGVFMGGISWTAYCGNTTDWTYNFGNSMIHTDKWQSAGSLNLVTILAVFAAVVVLFTTKYPKDIFKLVMGFNRWIFRVMAYATLMTDEYPPFRLWDD